MVVCKSVKLHQAHIMEEPVMRVDEHGAELTT